MVHLYARISEVDGPGGPTVRVSAPRITRATQAIVGLAAVGIAIYVVPAGAIDAPDRFVLSLAMIAALAVCTAGTLQFRASVAAGPGGLVGQAVLRSSALAWEEVDVVVWDHRLGRGLYTRTEISVRRRGRSDLETIAVLHYLRGNVYGALQSTDIGERFLRCCRHYGVSSKLGGGPVLGPTMSER